MNLTSHVSLSFVQILDTSDMFKNTEYSLSYFNKGKRRYTQQKVQHTFTVRTICVKRTS